jgi:sn-glycerol 3-phosphate transport system substrate-binding protein
MSFVRRALVGAALLLSATSLGAGSAHATDIDLYFPVPVQGKLSNEMQRLVGVFNAAHPDIKVTPVYTGSYDDTALKTRAAVQAGHSPAVVIMSANFLREFAINDQIVPLDDLIKADGQTNAQFMDSFWPALRINAMEQGHVYGAPFHNSTPILYYSVDAFKEAGLDPDHPPATWAEWVEDAQKLTKKDGDKVTRYGLEIISAYDTGGWLLSGFTMSNGGQYYNTAYGGEVYYNDPTTIGALHFMNDLVHKYHVMPDGVIDANAAAAAFSSGRTAMIVNSTGALGFMRDTMKTPFKTAFVPRAMVNAVAIGGASMVIPKGNTPEREKAAWTLIKWFTTPDISGGWSRFTGYFAPNRHAYELPAMQDYLKANPDAKVALDQLAYARPWFATYNTVGVRKAMEDQMQAMLSGKQTPEQAAANAQKGADELMRPYVEQTALKQP